MIEAGVTRSFLACWPDASISGPLYRCAQDIQEQVGGRAVSRDNLHVTLAFLGPLTQAQLSAVTACCEPLPGRFRLDLNRIGFWQNRGLVWAGPKSGDDVFKLFAESLRDRLRRVGFRVDVRPFLPHITLLRKARRRPRGFVLDGVSWLIDEYRLVGSELSVDGARYSVLNRWSTMGDVK